MKDPAAAAPKPCCVCDAHGGKHCTKCKSRHYCSKKCQLVDWNEGGHKEQCRQLTAKFQDRPLDELMPAKVKEETPIVDDVAPAAGFKAAPRLPAGREENSAEGKASALNDDTLDWRGTGVAQSYDEAVRWWRLAAAQGYADALYRLGACYANGQGVPRDNHEALRLYSKPPRSHKAQCKQMAANFQDRLLDELMPEKLKIKEKPAIVDDVAPAAGFKAAARLPAAATEMTAVVKASALNDDTPDWRGTCAICLDRLPIGRGATFYDCCCKSICTACSDKCDQYDERCPLCRAPPPKSDAESVRRLQEHVGKGNADAQVQLGDAYFEGICGLKQSFQRAFQYYERAEAQGHAIAQYNLAVYYDQGLGVKINFKTAARWYRRAAEQGLAQAQVNIGWFYSNGKGVAQSYGEAVKWYRLAAAQGYADALYRLGMCYEYGQGVSQDMDAALRCYRRAAAKGHAAAATAVAEHEAFIAATRFG
ncbi:hypothetical protein M885DRAFT_621604 [Pelagophyceae sp. CCMP2097]|nr:hypothetical protein M885DRAFT_621604 [Pelagophyceae sp. CCMP2097]